jgi:hypothetical protein
MSKRNTTKFYSIFGQIEEVAAETMIERGLATRIPFKQIPDEGGIKYNEKGEPAKFAIFIQSVNLQVFEDLIAELYA